MRSRSKIWAVDCETDPAKHSRVPTPFLWGAYDGRTFLLWRDTNEFVAWASQQYAILYAHNGGKFDFMFLIRHVGNTKAQIINGRIVKMYMGRAELRDSFAIITAPLSQFGKSEIDYRKMEADVREQHMDEITSYLRQDCVVLHDVVTEFRTIAGKATTIASNALRFSRKIGVNPGKTTPSYDRIFRPYFYGGRCQVFQSGTHEALRVLDIHSAYPYAMTFEHAYGDSHVHITGSVFRELPREEQQRCFIRLRCHSRGAFPQTEYQRRYIDQHDTLSGISDNSDDYKQKRGGLSFPDAYSEFMVTGWEYVAAYELGLLDRIEILDVIAHHESIHFRPYIDHWYAFKAAHPKKTEPVRYEIGKRMQNALYGKLSQDPARYYDYIIVPGGSHICPRFENRGDEYCEDCGEHGKDHGWEIADEYEQIEIHRRPALWKWKYKYGLQWEGRPVYNNVATGASITGFTRAHLLRAIHTVGLEYVKYCDTDSIICDATAPYERLPMTDKLGDWADEGTAHIGHFAAKKIYGLEMDEICSKFKGQHYEPCLDCNAPYTSHGSAYVKKIASKGSKLLYDDIVAMIGGKVVNWRSTFPHFTIAGQPGFVVRNIRRTAKLFPGHK